MSTGAVDMLQAVLRQDQLESWEGERKNSFQILWADQRKGMPDSERYSHDFQKMYRESLSRNKEFDEIVPA